MKKMLFMGKKEKKDEGGTQKASSSSTLAQQHQQAQQAHHQQAHALAQQQALERQQQLLLQQQQQQQQQLLAQQQKEQQEQEQNTTTTTTTVSTVIPPIVAALQQKAHDFCGTIMILGHTECGKTTLQRQLEFIYGVTDHSDIKHYQRLIYGNTLATLIRFIENSERLNITLSADNLARVKRILSQPIELARNRLPRFPLKLGWDCKCIWEDKVIQSVYNYSKICSEIRTPGRPKYYMDRMFKVFDPSYAPTEMDIISAYDQKDIIQSSTIIHKRFKVDLFGCSGRQSNTKNWNNLSSSYKPNYIFYVVALKDYFSDHIVASSTIDPSFLDMCNGHFHKNLLLESLNSFESLVKSELFEKSLAIYLIFNTSDIFYENIKQYDLKSCFPEYEGGNDSEKAISFISEKFTNLIKDKDKPYKSHIVNLLDKSNVRDEFEGIMDALKLDAEKRGFTTPYNHHGSSPASSFGSNSSSRLPNTSNSIPGLYDIEVSNKRQQQQLLQLQYQMHQNNLNNNNNNNNNNTVNNQTTTSTHLTSSTCNNTSNSINTASMMLDSNTDSSCSDQSSLSSSMTSLPNSLPVINNNNNSKPVKEPKPVKEKPIKEVKPVKEPKPIKEPKPVKEKVIKEPKPVKEKVVKEPKPIKEKVVKEPKPVKEKVVKPGKDKSGNEKNGASVASFKLNSGHGSLQGRRKNMEDTHSMIDNLIEHVGTKYNGPNKNEKISYFAVYDGHGGTETSVMLEPTIPKCLVESKSFKEGDYDQAFRDAYLEADDLAMDICDKSGSTGVSALIVGNKLYTANVGDSEIVLARAQPNSNPKGPVTYDPVLLSYKHLASDDQEKKRVTELGGMIIFNRLFGSLAVSRSFGDKEYKEGEKKFCVADPYQTTTELTPRDHFLILACDGLWDKVEYDEAVQFVQRNLKLGKNPTEIAELLAQDSYDRGSGDNITVLVVLLNWD